MRIYFVVEKLKLLQIGNNETGLQFCTLFFSSLSVKREEKEKYSD